MSSSPNRANSLSPDDVLAIMISWDEEAMRRFAHLLESYPNFLQTLAKFCVTSTMTALSDKGLQIGKKKKSNPKTIHRNVEICDLRKTDRRKWSLTKLAKRFNVSVRSITKVLSEEEKWRSLFASMRGN